MDRMTLREAAERTARSITTLRRYIRSGRLHAEKRYGRFGPEYYVSEQDLADAGLDAELRAPNRNPAPIASTVPAPTAGSELQPLGGRWLREIVPLSLYQDLQMKHEQLLVQYGMVRAGGLRAMELRAERDQAEKQVERLRQDSERVRRTLDGVNNRLKRELREARLELEGRQLQIAALEEKSRALEMLTRNAVTTETLDNQLRRLQNQHERVRDLQHRSTTREGDAAPVSRPSPDKTADH